MRKKGGEEETLHLGLGEDENQIEGLIAIYMAEPIK